VSGFIDEVDGEPRCLQCGVLEDDHPATYTYHTDNHGRIVMLSSCEVNEEWQDTWRWVLGVA